MAWEARCVGVVPAWSIGRCGVSSGDGMSDVDGGDTIEGVGEMECDKVEGIGNSSEAVAV
jgi:hypothetical protein